MSVLVARAPACPIPSTMSAAPTRTRLRPPVGQQRPPPRPTTDDEGSAAMHTCTCRGNGMPG
eukprot:2653765-Alexandrium_andersonii.AAC.1